MVEQVLEFIKGIAEVKSYSLIGRYNRRLEDTIEENVNANTDMELKLLPLMLTQNVVAKLIDMGVVVLSLILYTGGRMELLNCVMLCICSFLLTEGAGTSRHTVQPFAGGGYLRGSGSGHSGSARHGYFRCGTYAGAP